MALSADLRRLALRATLDAHYTRRPDDRPHVAEVTLFPAAARKLPIADRLELPTILRGIADAMDADIDPETLLAATVGHIASPVKPFNP